MSGIAGRIRRLEGRLSQASSDHARVDLLDKLRTGRISDADLPALLNLVEYEVHASLLLAARWNYQRLEESVDEPVSGDDRGPSRLFGSMRCASWTVAIPPGEPIDPAWAEHISLFGQRDRPLRKAAPANGLSASQQHDVARWVGSRLLMSVMVEPSAIALREELHRDWLEAPPADRIRIADSEHLRWLDEVESLLQAWPDIPILRGVNLASWRQWGWTNVYSDDEGERFCRPTPAFRDCKREDLIDVTAQAAGRAS